MKCRAMQVLHLLALQPIAEHYADKSSYGFRPKRSCADAMEKCYVSLARKGSSQFILEGDIKSCFNKISHKWLLDNIQMDKIMLSKWLSAGYIEKGILYPTTEGTAQGGIISPNVGNQYSKIYSVSGMTRWLHSNEFCYKKPHAVPAKADKKLQEAFIRYYNRLKAKLRFFKCIGRKKCILRERITDNFQILNSPLFAS